MDDATVAIENINSHPERGEPVGTAILIGTAPVFENAGVMVAGLDFELEVTES